MIESKRSEHVSAIVFSGDAMTPLSAFCSTCSSMQWSKTGTEQEGGGTLSASWR